MWRTIFQFILQLLVNFSLLSLTFDFGGLARSHVIETKSGLIEGVLKTARNQNYFHAYYGIPYARAPVGNLRFEPPVEADPWKGIFNATQQSPLCPQILEKSNDYAGQEDCLFLNVFTPRNAKPGSNIPVLFYIFGGEFRYGGAAKEGPEFIMSKDIVLVIVNYRIGLFGFLSTGDTVLPGNIALKDQALAMRWTRNNIYDFGGDPRRITIHGHSSGAMCVHLHTLSPLSQDYFDQAIMQSGVAVSPQAFWNRDRARCIAHKLAEHVNCTTSTSELLKQCLLEKTSEELVRAAETLYIWNGSQVPAVFKPVIEDKLVYNAFLNENPLTASYVSQTKPWLLGMTSDETASGVRDWVVNKSWIFNMDFRSWLPVSTSVEWTSKPSHVDFILQLVKTKFFGDSKISIDTASNMVKLLNGIMFGRGLTDVLQKYPAIKYVYLFDYRYIGSLGTDLPFLGIGHASELAVIFNRTDGKGKTAEDWAFGDEMITRWVNFAHSGNPNVPFPINTSVFGSWTPASTPRIEFLRITDKGSMERDYFVEKFGFWKKVPIFSNYF